MFYPVIFQELMQLTGTPIEDIKKEFIQFFDSERENSEKYGVLMNDIRVIQKSNVFFESNGKIYTSFQNSITQFKNGKLDNELYFAIAAISEDGGSSWYFIELEGNELARNILSKELPERGVNALYPRHD